MATNDPVPPVGILPASQQRRKTTEIPIAGPAQELAALKEQVAAQEEAMAVKDRRISAMKEIGRALGATLNLDDVLALIMRHVTVLLDADRSTLYLVDPRTKEIYSRVAQGDGITEIRLPMGVGVAGWVAKADQPVNIKDAYADKRFNPAVDRKTGYKTVHILAVPMHNQRGKIVGVVQVLNKKGGSAFTDEDQRTLEAIAPQAAAAIENAFLYEEALKQNQAMVSTQGELRRKVEELNLLCQFAQALVRANNAQQVVHLVLERSVVLFGAQAAALLQTEGPAGVLHFLAPGLAGLESSRPQRLGGMEPADGLIGWVATHTSPLVVSNASEDARHTATLATRTDLAVEDFCGVPLVASDGMPVGALALFNRPGGFSEADALLLGMLANQTAKALEAASIKEKDQNAQRLQTIGQMLSGIVHDFKTPITIISGYVQLMTRSESTEEREEFAELILKQFDNLSQMTRDLLQFAKGEVEVLLGKVYLQNFIAEMEELLSRIFDGSGVELVVEPKFRGAVRMDQARMSRVVTNIARNALEAMPNGGRFTFTVQQSGESVLMEFADTGPGIAEELEGRLFTEFATHGKADGTGLGLAVVKRIVQEHHGDITYESRPGQGTTFTVRLPL